MNSRLFHLKFDDIANLELGGEVRIVVVAHTGEDWQFRLLDSVTLDLHGRVFLREDPARSSALSRTFVLDREENVRLVATANSKFFEQGGDTFLTKNEETAGIVPADEILGEGWFLTAVQCNDAAAWKNIGHPKELSDEQWEKLKRYLVMLGQLLAVYVPPGIEEELPGI